MCIFKFNCDTNDFLQQQQQTIVLINDPIYPGHSIHSSFTKTFREKQKQKNTM